MSNKIHLALDGREANVAQRVGSNVYAFQILQQLAELTQTSDWQKKITTTVLLSAPPVADFPEQRSNWRYQIVKPSKFWTQWAEPWHLFFNQDKYDLLFTPGHYAPRLAAIPYISSVMDLAFLEYPDQFKTSDLVQLKNWTKYSVKRAAKVVAISEFTKQQVHQHYHKPLDQIIVAYPDVNLATQTPPPARMKAFYRRHNLHQPFFLFVGTVQPRKNLEQMISSYEYFVENLFESSAEAKSSLKTGATNQPPQLVIAGKIGWLATHILDRVKQSPQTENIKLVGYVSNQIKTGLIQDALATILLGLYEGFGIPPLESLQLGTIPIVADTSSLPEVVGPAGILVPPRDTAQIAAAFNQVLEMSAKETAGYAKLAREQVKKFSWNKSAQTILAEIFQLATKNR